MIWIKKISSPKMRNREFVFTPKIEYKLVAERSEANQNSLTFPTWCSILELVRTHFAACGGEEVPPRKFGKAAEPHRSKLQKNPEKNIGSNHILILGEENFLIIKSMSKFEGAPNINNPEINPAKVRADVNVGKNLEGELTPEESEKLKTEEGSEQETEKTELSPEKQAEDGLENDKEQPTEEEKITNLIGQINDVDERIFNARKSAAQDEAKLKSLRESMGLTSGSDTSPNIDFNNNRVASLEVEKAELTEQREKWIEEFGRDNLPEGLAVEEGEDSREAKGVSPEKEPELTDKEKREQTEERRKWLEAWKKDAVVNFEKGMRDDWRTKDAINLDLTIEVMKLRVPNAMEKEMKDFVDGKTDEPPSVVWIHWKCNSFFDQVLGKPNMIKNLEITFDNEVVKLADEKDLEKKEEETEESKSGAKSGETLPDDKKPAASSPESNAAERPKA